MSATEDLLLLNLLSIFAFVLLGLLTLVMFPLVVVTLPPPQTLESSSKAPTSSSQQYPGHPILLQQLIRLLLVVLALIPLPPLPLTNHLQQIGFISRFQTS